MTEMAVVIPYFNPAGYRSHELKLRRSLAAYHAAGLGDHVWLAGAGPRPAVPARVAFWDDACPFLWHKERLINLAAAHLPARYTRIAWMDSDVLVGPDWAAAVDAAFADASVVQCFTGARYATADGLPTRRRVGAMVDGSNAAIGLAWAARRCLFDDGPGLFELGLVGGGDSVLGLGVLEHTPTPALPWLGGHRQVLDAAWSAALLAELDRWLAAAREWHGTARVGAAATEIDVVEHGAVVRRDYTDRHALLADLVPDRDISTVGDGVRRWTERGLNRIEPSIRAYFLARREDDGLDLEPEQPEQPEPRDDAA